MNRFSRISFAVVTALAVIAGTAFAAPSVFNAHLSGKNESPVRETKATGQATFTVSSDATSMQYKINVGNIDNVTTVRLQLAPGGETGDVIAVLYGPVAPGGGKVTGQLSTGAIAASNLTGSMAGRTISDLVSEIKAGRVFVNISTDDGLAPTNERPGDFSSGEIQGVLQ